MRDTSEPPAGVPWHSLSIEDVHTRLGTSGRGLSREEVARRQERDGPNALPAARPPGISGIVLHQVKSPLIYILLIAGVISVLIGDIKDAAFIILVVVINAVIGAVQEWKAEQSALELQGLLRVTARVRRDDRWQTVPAEELVVGDLVLMDTGNRVPADIRLLHAANLTVDESLLTGESAAVQKAVGVLDEDTPVSDRTNMAYAGSTVVTGRGCGAVTGTGTVTEVGSIARAVSGTESAKPPLLIRMEDFSRKVGLLIVAASLVMALAALSRGVPPVEVFFLAVALVVAAIPEGLPVAITVALSIASSRMARRNVIVRKLAAVESLGSCTTIATDKTGTLTVNEQTARVVVVPPGERVEASGAGYTPDGAVPPLPPALAAAVRHLARTAVICNGGSLYQEDGRWVHYGDAMDVALLTLAYKTGLDPDRVRNSVRVVAEVPFESERMYAAVYYRDIGDTADTRPGVAVKGALEVVLPYCATMTTADGPVPLDAATVDESFGWLMENGYRVLAVADGRVPSPPEGAPDLPAAAPSLSLLGLVGFIDPLRPDVKEAVGVAHGAGIDVVMITGDHPRTALAIARDLDIARSEDEVMTGRQMDEMGGPGSPSVAAAIGRTRVFARVSPVQKMEIVDALVGRGHFVAVTGDGVNDAPALRRANIGVAMGSGTDVAKDTAALIVTDDTFSSIVAGVEEGRFAYDNIRKVTYLLISAGLSEVVLFILALLAGLPIPLLAVQLLWLNLVTNGIQGVALAFEAGEEGAMQRRPRDPAEGIFNGLMVRETLLSGMTVGVAAFSAFWWLTASGVEETMARNLLLLLMVLFGNFHAFNCRSEYRSLFRVPLRDNTVLVLGVVLMQGLHILSLHVPVMQDLLGLAPVTLEQWSACLAVAAVVVVMEAFKFFRRGNET
ncbi:HAD-IC family P-type ATPase [uncultured Methanofollis sp.]|uniref:cation-translocating P-type ATPase n=1 Tax=uncultured Methanofollis sp. TaxID=262500 RepID=UPI0026243D4B|nr:HAD-IC family P-type ATPase [uncultured Methanofollis sp.]